MRHLLSATLLLCACGLASSAETIAQAAIPIEKLVSLGQPQLGRSDIEFSNRDFQEILIPLVQGINSLAPAKGGSPVTFQRLMIDAKRKEQYVTYGKWTAIAAVSTGVVILTWGTTGPLITGVGSAIGGTMGLSGAAASSAGLAFLGGGAISAGGFGIAGGRGVGDQPHR